MIFSRKFTQILALVVTLFTIGCKQSSNVPPPSSSSDESKNSSTKENAKKPTEIPQAESSKAEEKSFKYPFHGGCIEEEETDGSYVTTGCTEVYKATTSTLIPFYEAECKKKSSYKRTWTKNKKCSRKETIGACERESLASSSISILYYVEEDGEENQSAVNNFKKTCLEPSIYTKPTSKKL